jgi:hypothetical protein
LVILPVGLRLNAANPVTTGQSPGHDRAMEIVPLAPATWDTLAELFSAGLYTGTAAMFERAGFTLAAPTTSKASAGTPRVVMRRAP